MTNAMILIAACIMQLLGGIPDLDADHVPMKRLRIAGTAYPPERIPISDWFTLTNASRLDRTPPDYWKRIKEAHGIASRR